MPGPRGDRPFNSRTLRQPLELSVAGERAAVVNATLRMGSILRSNAWDQALARPCSPTQPDAFVGEWMSGGGIPRFPGPRGRVLVGGLQDLEGRPSRSLCHAAGPSSPAAVPITPSPRRRTVAPATRIRLASTTIPAALLGARGSRTEAHRRDVDSLPQTAPCAGSHSDGRRRRPSSEMRRSGEAPSARGSSAGPAGMPWGSARVGCGTNGGASVR